MHAILLLHPATGDPLHAMLFLHPAVGGPLHAMLLLHRDAGGPLHAMLFLHRDAGGPLHAMLLLHPATGGPLHAMLFLHRGVGGSLRAILFLRSCSPCSLSRRLQKTLAGGKTTGHMPPLTFHSQACALEEREKATKATRREAHASRAPSERSGYLGRQRAFPVVLPPAIFFRASGSVMLVLMPTLESRPASKIKLLAPLTRT